MKNENSVPALAETQSLTDTQKAVAAGSMQESLEKMYAAGDQPLVLSSADAKRIGDPLLDANGPVMGTAAPPGLPVGYTAPGLRTEQGPDNYPGGFAAKILALFFSKHPERREELESFEAAQLAEHQAIQKFKSLEKQLNEFRTWAEAIRIEVSNYQKVDLARTLFENRFNVGHFTAIVNSPAYQTAFALKTYGEDVLRLLDLELDAMGKAHFGHVKANKELLQKRGLI